MLNKLKRGAFWLWRKSFGILIAILTFILLMIDRMIMIPFPFMTSYSADQLSQKENRFAAYVILRVGIFAIIVLIILLIKWIF
tara:strand:+ start:975 stop:1223 length:249 start_codon:yes stop_codon:yes gene_type:complete